VHELSIAYATVRSLEEQLPGQQVLGVRLRVGVLAGVVPEALQFGWDIAISGTAMAGSALTIEHVPLPMACSVCEYVGLTGSPPPISCPACGAVAVPTAAGRELEIASVELADGPEPHDPNVRGSREQDEGVVNSVAEL